MARSKKPLTSGEITFYPKPYRIRKFDENGKIIEERWAVTKHRADQEAADMGLGPLTPVTLEAE